MSSCRSRGGSHRSKSREIPNARVHVRGLGRGSSGGGLPQSRDHRSAQTNFRSQDCDEGRKPHDETDSHNLAGKAVCFHGPTLSRRPGEVLIERIRSTIDSGDTGCRGAMGRRVLRRSLARHRGDYRRQGRQGCLWHCHPAGRRAGRVERLCSSLALTRPRARWILRESP